MRGKRAVKRAGGKRRFGDQPSGGLAATLLQRLGANVDYLTTKTDQALGALPKVSGASVTGQYVGNDLSKAFDRALKEAAAAVVDWGGGTRIGESLHRFNYDWGRRVLGRGAVVLLISDGWERGDPELLEREMARLHRTCQRLIWLNPLLGRPGYEPLTRGMRSALPHVDDFLPVHDLESLEQLAAVLEGLK